MNRLRWLALLGLMLAVSSLGGCIIYTGGGYYHHPYYWHGDRW
ncbi:MAG TPA: hypothetical protein VN668_00265 [Stellaceae bacterium]|nr:hypothetical protein [Stellaceae bacterium]